MTRPVFVAKSTDFQTFDADNYVQVAKELDGFYHYMLRKFGAYAEPRFKQSAERFWQFAFQRRLKFDRSKSRLTTWLGFIVHEFVTSERQAVIFGIPVEHMADYTPASNTRPKPRQKQFFLLPSGLNPAIIPDRQHREIDTGAENVSFVDSSFGNDIELRQLINLLPEEERRLLELRELGYTGIEIAEILKIEDRAVWWMIGEARIHLQALLDNKLTITQRKKSKWNFGSYMNKTWWDEWFRTRRLAFPITVMSQEELNKLPVFKW